MDTGRRREKLNSEYAAEISRLRGKAAERITAGKADPTQIIEQGSKHDRNERAVDAQRAKAAGTNRMNKADEKTPADQ